jgi:hypothetical protein
MEKLAAAAPQDCTYRFRGYSNAPHPRIPETSKKRRDPSVYHHVVSVSAM